MDFLRSVEECFYQHDLLVILHACTWNYLPTLHYIVQVYLIGLVSIRCIDVSYMEKLMDPGERVPSKRRQFQFLLNNQQRHKCQVPVVIPIFSMYDYNTKLYSRWGIIGMRMERESRIWEFLEHMVLTTSSKFYVQIINYQLI